MSLHLPSGQPPTVEEHQGPSSNDTNSVNHPRLGRGRAKWRYVVYKKPVTARHKASTSRNSEGELRDIARQKSSTQSPRAGNQQQDVCQGHSSKEVNDVLIAFANTPSSTLASLQDKNPSGTTLVL